MTQPLTTVRPESILHARDPVVLQRLLDFYAPPGSRVLDATANRRRMWSGVRWGSVTYMDIDAQHRPDVVGSFAAMPFVARSFDVIVFDPPHLPAAAGSAHSHRGMVADYGLRRTVKGDNVSSVFEGFLREARRVLTPDGLVFAKLKDYVHNHRYQWTLCDFIAAVRAAEMTPCDLWIKRDPAGGNLKSGRWQKAHHARNVHAWWVVVRNGSRCEPPAAWKEIVTEDDP